MRHLSSLPLAMIVLTVSLAGAFAAGDGGGGGSDSAQSQCKRGEVWDKKKKKCVPAQRGAVDDESLYEAARDLAYMEHPQEALDLLELAQNKNDPRILNYLGYTNRKLGRVEVGMKYYQAAIAAKPDYTLVREYLGEAYLQLGDVRSAKEQLTIIGRLCGSNACLEYKDLSEEIAEYERQS